MMDREKALKWCEDFEDNLIESGLALEERGARALEALGVCRKALKGTSPQAPKYNARRGALCPACDGELYIRVLRCGILRRDEIKIEEKTPFCKWCGQALDWKN